MRAVTAAVWCAIALSGSACGATLTDPADGGASGDAAASADAAALDAGVRDGGPPPPSSAPVLYVGGRRHSPITEDIASALRAVRASRPAAMDDVFAKIGASSTVSGSFMRCFAGNFVDLDGRDHLQSTADHFLTGDAAGETPYERTSLSATVGWHAGRALMGDPSPLDQEVAAISPRFALVLYGTNDINIVSPERYGRNMTELTDRLLDEGVVPILSSVMPRDDSATADAEVPLYNAIVRAVAQSRQVPFVDYHAELIGLPDHGLSGDGIHASTYRQGGARPCVFTAEGLRYGYNIRNLVVMESLHRALDVMLRAQPAPDPQAPRLRGVGTFDDPHLVQSLPFVHGGTTASGDRRLASYTGCSATQNESGPERLYRLELTTQTRVTAYVVSQEGVDIDLHLLDQSATEGGCITRDHRRIEADLDPGTYYFALDSFVSSGGTEMAGDYLFVVVAS